MIPFVQSHELIKDSVEVVGDLLDLGLLHHQVFLHLWCDIWGSLWWEWWQEWLFFFLSAWEWWKEWLRERDDKSDRGYYESVLAVGLLHYLALLHFLWEFVVVRVMVRVKKICPSQSNKQKSKSNKKKDEISPSFKNSKSSSTLSILTLSRPMSISAFSLRVSAISNFAISSWSSSWWKLRWQWWWW